MTARGYEQDEALRALKERIRRLELKEARNRPASGVTVSDPGGYFGGPGLTIEEVIALIGAGSAPDSFLLNTLGGKDKIQDLGTIGASTTVDLANASVFLGVMDVDVTIGTTGWTNLRRCTIGLSLTEDGSGGNTPTLTSVTWIGGTPTWDTTAGTTTHVILFSDDGGTTIWGAVVGGNASSAALLALIAKAFGYSPHGSMGATETFDAATGWHSGTFNANCTFTLTADVADTSSLFLELAQDGTGGWTLTLPASVVNRVALEAEQDTTLSTTSFLILLSRDSGTTWYGGWWGGSSGGALSLDDLTDVVITAVAADETLQYDGSDWVNSSRRWEPVTFDPGTGPEIVFDATDIVMTWETY